MKFKQYYSMPFSFYAVVICILISIAYLGSKAVTVINENTTAMPQNTVIIDAGHGGVDGGATSCTGVMEKDINLEIAKRLDDLMHLIGIHTKMIRTDDCSIHKSGETIASKKVSDLNERVRIVNETSNGILISIHQNYFTDGRYSGAQVFYSNSTGSDSFAKALQSKFTEILNTGITRQAKKASGIYLMEHIEKPGVLIECGFLSNYEEESLLRTPEYQKKICCIITAQTTIFTKEHTVA